MVSLKLDDVNFNKLVKSPDKNEKFTYNKHSNAIRFLNKLLGNRYIEIKNSDYLAYALKRLRVRGLSKVEFMVV
jgi:hypothetical protein